MWQTKVFRTKESMQQWITKNQHKTQWNEIFINNAYGIEFKPLRVI
jgi:hypothetical protein